ncbi:arginyl-tRNA synthetase [Streptomyces collinus Tu 365]|uniref:arginine--tRNA ligase n=1 Tax=Streptomyces collinus (strain DSM 40733 / Tue 365) TaxID=1214242 RepID=S5UX63_STRC3|nr:arginyl-tRNA synthetase [Streptomyces collinus Tu 365]
MEAGELVVPVPERVVVGEPGAGGCGDFATNVALRLARPAGLPPLKVAEVLRAHLLGFPGIRDVVVTGPGFLNISLGEEADPVVALVREIRERGSAYGHSELLAGQVVVLRVPYEVRAEVVADAVVRIVASQGGRAEVEHGEPVNLRPVPAPEDPAPLGADAAQWALLHPAPHDRPRITADHLAQRESNPLFRVRYAHARVRSVMRNAGRLGFDAEPGPLEVREVDSPAVRGPKPPARSVVAHASRPSVVPEPGAARSVVVHESKPSAVPEPGHAGAVVTHEPGPSAVREPGSVAVPEVSEPVPADVVPEPVAAVPAVPAGPAYAPEPVPADVPQPVPADVREFGSLPAREPGSLPAREPGSVAAPVPAAAGAAGAASAEVRESASAQFPGFTAAHQHAPLLTALSAHPRILAAAATHRAPDRLARHLVTLADAVLPFLYTVLPCGEEKPSAAHRARLALAEAAGTVLAGGLSLLGIDAPEHL